MKRPPLAAIALGVVTGLISVYGFASLLESASCTTHVLGPTDTAALRDSLELEGRIYRETDGGRIRAYARGSYCSDLSVLTRSGAAPVDAGIAPIECGVPK